MVAEHAGGLQAQIRRYQAGTTVAKKEVSAGYGDARGSKENFAFMLHIYMCHFNIIWLGCRVDRIYIPGIVSFPSSQLRLHATSSSRISEVRYNLREVSILGLWIPIDRGKIDDQSCLEMCHNWVATFNRALLICLQCFVRFLVWPSPLVAFETRPLFYVSTCLCCVPPRVRFPAARCMYGGGTDGAARASWSGGIGHWHALPTTSLLV